MFKFILICSLIAAALALPPKSHASNDDVHAETKYYDSDVRTDGFRYVLETTNGIKGYAHGEANGNSHGAYEWVSPEGEHILVNYVADENGYQPNSDTLPTPHPIPEAIVKSLDYIAAHPPKDTSHQGHHEKKPHISS